MEESYLVNSGNKASVKSAPCSDFASSIEDEKYAPCNTYYQRDFCRIKYSKDINEYGKLIEYVKSLTSLDSQNQLNFRTVLTFRFALVNRTSTREVSSREADDKSAPLKSASFKFAR